MQRKIKRNGSQKQNGIHDHINKTGLLIIDYVKHTWQRDVRLTLNSVWPWSINTVRLSLCKVCASYSRHYWEGYKQQLHKWCEHYRERWSGRGSCRAETLNVHAFSKKLIYGCPRTTTDVRRLPTTQRGQVVLHPRQLFTIRWLNINEMEFSPIFCL